MAVYMSVYTDEKGHEKYKHGVPFKAWSKETSVPIDIKIVPNDDWEIIKTDSDKEYTDRFTVKPV